ncbi:MAG: TVP38/TMEM64 family protein [Kiloniellaceae bacterium]
MSEPKREPAGGRGVLKRLLPAAVLLAGLGTFLALGGHRYLAFDTLEAHRETLLALVEAQGAVAVLGFILLYAVMVALSIPGALVMTVSAGFLFGTLLGAACSVIGATLGAVAVFLAARTAIGDLLRQRAGPALRRMRDGFQEDALSYLLVLRLIPLFPFWLVNLVPAFLGVSLKNFVAGTLLGIIPGSLVYASVGNGLGAIFEAGETDSIKDAILEPEVLLPLAGLIVLSLLPVLYKKVLHKNVKGRNDGGTDAS